MKRKFILYPAVALALMTSASLSSCVDTDEPDSIADLRAAVSTEIKANADLLEAKAAVENAYVAKVNADAKYQELLNAYQEYVNAEKAAEAAANIALSKQNEAKTDAETASLVEAAKLDAEAKAVKAKQDLESAQEKYQENVEQLKTALLKAQLAERVAIAKINAEGLDDLQKAAKDWDKAVKDVKTEEDNLAKLYSDAIFATNKEDLENEVTKQKKAVRQAEDALATVNREFAEKKSDAFATLWKDYQVKVDGVEAQVDSLTGVLTKLQQELVPLTKAKSDAVDAFNKKTAPAKAAPGNFSSTVVDTKDVANYGVKVENTELKALVEGENLEYKTHDKAGDGAVEVTGKFEYKDGKFVPNTKILLKDIADVIKPLKAAFQKYQDDKLGQNSRTFKAVKEKFEGKLNDKLSALGSDNTKGKRKDWTSWMSKYNTAVSGNKKADYETAVAELQTLAVELFGVYADGSKTINGVKGDWTQFVSASFSDNIVDLLIKRGYGKTEADILGTEGTSLGLYGEWKYWDSANKNGNVLKAVLSDAEDAVKECDKVIKAYNDKLTELTNTANGIEKSDAVKAEREKKEAAEAAEKAKNDEIKAVNDKLTPLSTEKANNEAMANYYKGIVEKMSDKLKTGTDDVLDAYSYETLRAYAVADKEYDLAVAQRKLAEAEDNLKAYEDGTFVDTDKSKAKAKIEAQEKKVEDAKTAEAEAKAEYDKLKAYYGYSK